MQTMLDDDLPVSKAIQGEIVRDNEIVKNDLKELLRHLNPIQIKFVIAMMYHKSEADALVAIELPRSVLNSWPEKQRRTINDAIAMIAWDSVQFAQALMKEYMLQAVLVKISGLQSEDEQIRQKVATELIEWQHGKAKTRMQIDQNTTHHLKMYSTVSPDDWDDKPDDDQ